MRRWTLPLDRALLVVPSTRPALADLAAALASHPSRRLKLVGVTGTDGKTSTTRLLASILDRAGQRTGWLTTVDLKIGDRVPEHPGSHHPRGGPRPGGAGRDGR